MVGAGYLAGHVGRRLAALGHHPVLSSRHRPTTPGTRGLDWLPADVVDPDSLTRLLATARADTVVTVHGPSDITWCEANPALADAAHHGGARRLAALLDGRRALMISTDNVFPGHRTSYGESDPTAPANAYGRAKLAAERALLATGNALALRVSLVYGWDRAGLRPNFFTTSALRLAAGEPVAVPDDHWNTPVLADDVAAWTAALLTTEHTGVLHLGGPRRLSRLDWARHLARAQGADPALARAAPRDDTAYACRPRNACLHSERAATVPELRGLEPVDVLEASTRLIAAGEEPP
ncbi:SDR family oxidoreductase [Streptomyces hainanensis]|uniref:NAD-dependent epimerase/dehydratase family protein n=1 Tax=Streptomyces hainanensis TaxID=402648 RepID=A0A4R4T139_9ACTN|nr:sugar nucleotide-binding protein [Streptomyces hainanensis]TDC68103.1 NAD-dependent epimerase/dehydratase family protein [Streptomyces hainanensis]